MPSAEVIDELVTDTMCPIPGPAAAHRRAVVNIFFGMLLHVLSQVAFTKKTFVFASGDLAKELAMISIPCRCA